MILHNINLKVDKALQLSEDIFDPIYPNPPELATRLVSGEFSGEIVMDNTKKYGGPGSSWCWTNERHVRFLNSIEASFVQTMFQNNNSNHPTLRLDRQLPDCFDSTQDLGKERRRRYSTSDVAEYSSSVKSDKKNKRLSSHDQVVPQLDNRIDDDGIKDEKDRV